MRELTTEHSPLLSKKKINELVREVNRLKKKVSALEGEDALREEMQVQMDGFVYDDGPLWKFVRDSVERVQRLTEGQKRLNSSVYGKREPYGAL